MATNSRRCRRGRTRHRGYQKSPPGVTRFTAGRPAVMVPCSINTVRLMGVMSMLSPFAILRQLRLGKESSTFERLGRSRHVADLRLIFSVTVILMIVGVIAALAFCYEYQVVTNWNELHQGNGVWPWVKQGFAAIVVQRTVHRRDLHIGWRRARLDISDRQRAARCGGPVRLRDRHALPRRRRGRHGAAIHHAVREGPAGRGSRKSSMAKRRPIPATSPRRKAIFRCSIHR